MSKESKTDVQTATAGQTVSATFVPSQQELVEQLNLALAMIEAYGQRLDALEAISAAPQAVNIHDGRARVLSNDAPPSTGTEVTPDNLAKWQKLQEQRANSASRGPLKVDPARLEQVAREIEGQNLTSVTGRLHNMKTAGKLADFRVLPPGSSSPSDQRADRLLLTCDSNGFIVSADVG